MNVLILTGKFGMGHLSAARSLQQHIDERLPGAQTQVVDLFEFLFPRRMAMAYSAYESFVFKCSRLFNVCYKTFSHGRGRGYNLVMTRMLDQFHGLLCAVRPDVIISDISLASRFVSLYKDKRRGGAFAAVPLITCITDINEHSSWYSVNTDYYLVPTLSVRCSLMCRGVDPRRIIVYGVPVKRQFSCICRREKPAGERKKELLLMGGGYGSLPTSTSFYEALNRLPDVHVTVVTGRNQKLYDKFHGRFEGMSVLGFTNQVVRLMADADLVVTKAGGISLFEAVAAEVPILIFKPQLVQEEDNADYFARYEIGKVLPRQDSKCIEEIARVLSDPDKLAQMRQNMLRLKARLDPERLIGVLSDLQLTRKGEDVCENMEGAETAAVSAV